MKTLTSKKAILGILLAGSVVLAGTWIDINSRTVSKSHDALDLAPAERSLASNEIMRMKIAVMKVEMSEQGKVDGEWEIVRIIASNEVVTFDKNNNPEDAKKNLKIPFKLVETSMVMLNKDKDLIYYISHLSDSGTIAIFKKMGEGYEIIEAKKVVQKNELIVDSGEVELVLERALNQNKSSKILTGADAVGEVVLTKNSIEGLSIKLTNTNGEVQDIVISSAQLLDGGAFKADVDDHEVSGVMFNNGKDGYRLSFVTGPLAGAMLNFVTKEELVKIEERQANSESNDDYYAEIEKQNAKLAQEEALADRREISSNPDSVEPVRILSADEVKDQAETQGFNF
jgi:hypothetical protein